jgi:hypothetical protein
MAASEDTGRWKIPGIAVIATVTMIKLLFHPKTPTKYNLALIAIVASIYIHNTYTHLFLVYLK